MTMNAQDVADAGLRDWTFADNTIQREFSTKDFASALTLVNSIGELAEQRNHHPDLELGWGRVAVHLTSHDTGGVTDRDIDLARAIDAL